MPDHPAKVPSLALAFSLDLCSAYCAASILVFLLADFKAKCNNTRKPCQRIFFFYWQIFRLNVCMYIQLRGSPPPLPGTLPEKRAFLILPMKQDKIPALFVLYFVSFLVLCTCRVCFKSVKARRNSFFSMSFLCDCATCIYFNVYQFLKPEETRKNSREFLLVFVSCVCYDSPANYICLANEIKTNPLVSLLL